MIKDSGRSSVRRQIWRQGLSRTSRGLFLESCWPTWSIVESRPQYLLALRCSGSKNVACFDSYPGLIDETSRRVPCWASAIRVSMTINLWGSTPATITLQEVGNCLVVRHGGWRGSGVEKGRHSESGACVIVLGEIDDYVGLLYRVELELKLAQMGVLFSLLNEVIVRGSDAILEILVLMVLALQPLSLMVWGCRR